MAQMVRCRVGLLSLKCMKNSVSRVILPEKYQRLCFHTSWILNVKGKELFMPSLSPTMETGTIVKWIKKEGEAIQPGDAVADIQTDKAVMTFEMEDEGIMAKIIVPEGTKDIKVGTLIALTVDPDEDWKSVEMPDSAGAPASAPTPSAPSPAASAPVQAAEPPPGQVNVAMPALSPTMTTGTIVKWLKKEGDEISPGDAVAEIQTDKAVMTFEMEEEGILAKLLVEEGSQVEVGQLIAITVEKGMDPKSVIIPTSTKPSATPAAAAPQAAAPAPSAAPAGDKPPPSGQVYGLAVKRLLEEYGLSSGSVKGTGRPNRLLKSDVLAYIQSKNLQRVAPKAAAAPGAKAAAPAAAAAPSAPKPTAPKKSGPSTYKDYEISNIRAVIAKRLGESKSGIPHSYATVDVNINKLNDLRDSLKADNIKVSVNDFVTKAVAHALTQCPDVNALYKNGEVVRMQNVDISVAVSTPSGLITPIVFDTPSKSLSDISSDIRTLAGKAREGTLKPNEFQGGTFTISNLGMFGIKEFSAIINPPQIGILAVGTGREVLVADASVESATDGDIDITFRKSVMMSATLSYDRRAIDEDQAAEFLSVLRSILEEPAMLTIGRGQQAMRHRR